MIIIINDPKIGKFAWEVPEHLVDQMEEICGAMRVDPDEINRGFTESARLNITNFLSLLVRLAPLTGASALVVGIEFQQGFQAFCEGVEEKLSQVE